MVAGVHGPPGVGVVLHVVQGSQSSAGCVTVPPRPVKALTVWATTQLPPAVRTGSVGTRVGKELNISNQFDKRIYNCYIEMDLT